MSKLQAQVISRLGTRCRNCGTVDYAILVQLWSGDRLVKNLQLCVECIAEGVSADLVIPMEKPSNPDETRRRRERIKRSRKMEAKLAEDVGGKVQPASGSSRIPGFKGDVRKAGSWRIEHKYTDSLKQYVLKLPDLAKITMLAMQADEFPALVVEFARVKESFTVIPTALFLEMMDGTD